MRTAFRPVPAALAAMAIAGSPAPILAQAPGFAPPLAITGARLIDGTGAPPRAGTTILIADGRIAAVGPDGGVAIPDGVQRRAVDGATAIPGLIDAHTHLEGDPSADDWREGRERVLSALLRGGVTSVRDMAGNARSLRALRDDVEAGRIAGPRIHYTALVAGPGFFVDPRVRAASGEFEPGDAPWARAITAGSDIEAVVDDAVAIGATGIKAYALVDPDLLARVAAAAHRRGLQVWAHATVFPARPSDAVVAGVDVLSHATYLVWEAAPPTEEYTWRAQGGFAGTPSDDPAIAAVLDAMVAAGARLDPTGAIMNRIASRDEIGPERARWTAAVTRLAHERGVELVAGTDLPERAAGSPPLHEELAALVDDVGLSPMGALLAATRNAARALGREAELGTIEPGKLGDLVVLDADPLADIHNTTRIRLVVRGGVPYEPSRPSP